MNLIKPITLLIADDHYVVRMGLAAILEQVNGLAVVGQADDGLQAVELHQRHQPNVTLMDLRMPGLDGVQATIAILEQCPQARIVMLTTYDGDEDIQRALHAGACGYLLKTTPGDELIRAIRQVHAGQEYLPAALAKKLADRAAAPNLTPREIEVLTMVVKGLSNKEIADVLGMTEQTAKVHLRNIFEKLGARDRTEAAMLALKRGIVHLT